MARLLGEGGVVAIGQTIGLVLATATSVIVARMSGPEGRGLLSLVTTFPQIVVLVATFGLLTANVFVVQRSPSQLRTAYGNSILVFALAATATCVVLIAARSQLLGSILRGLNPVGLGVIAVSLYPILFHRLTLSLLQATRRIGRLVVQEVVFQSSRLVATLSLLAALGPVAGIPIALLASASVAALLDLLALHRGGVGTPAYDGTLLRSSLKLGTKWQTAEITEGLSTRVDLFIVSAFCGASQVGIYATARSLAEGLLLPVGALIVPLYPRLVTLTMGEGGLLAARAARGVFWVVMGGAMVMFLVSGPVIRLLFGSEFDSARAPLGLLFLGVVPFSVGRVVNAFLSSSGRPGLVALLASAGLVVSILLCVLWIPKYGPLGAAAASAGSHLLMTVSAAAMFQKVSGVSATTLFVPQRGDVGMALARLREVRRPWPR